MPSAVTRRSRGGTGSGKAPLRLRRLSIPRRSARSRDRREAREEEEEEGKRKKRQSIQREMLPEGGRDRRRGAFN